MPLLLSDAMPFRALAEPTQIGKPRMIRRNRPFLADAADLVGGEISRINAFDQAYGLEYPLEHSVPRTTPSWIPVCARASPELPPGRTSSAAPFQRCGATGEDASYVAEGGDPPRIDQTYVDRCGPVVDRQLQRAGVRLAMMLNTSVLLAPATQRFQSFDTDPH
jgi:hypothetical protein